MFALHHLYSYSSKYENVTKQKKITCYKKFHRWTKEVEDPLPTSIKYVIG